MDSRPKAIIVTFPVKFLIDLGYTVLRRDYELAFHKNTESRLRKYKKKGVKPVYMKDIILNTKKSIISLGYLDFLKQIDEMEKDPEMYWLHSMGNKPAYCENILYCYINILSKIRYKAKVIEFQSAPKGYEIKHEFNDGRKRTGKHWLLLHQFEKLKPEIKMGGFQGFRYWNEDYAGRT